MIWHCSNTCKTIYRSSYIGGIVFCIVLFTIVLFIYRFVWQSIGPFYFDTVHITFRGINHILCYRKTVHIPFYDCWHASFNMTLFTYLSAWQSTYPCLPWHCSYTLCNMGYILFILFCSNTHLHDSIHVHIIMSEMSALLMVNTKCYQI